MIIKYNITTIFFIFIIRCTASAQSMCIKHFNTNDGLAGNHVYMCHQDNDGYLWIATTSGLSRFDGKKFRNYGHEDGLSDNEVMFVTNDAGNNIWVKTFSFQSAVSVIRNPKSSNPTHPLPNEVFSRITDEWYDKDNKTTYLSGKGVVVCIRENKTTIINVPVIGGCPVFVTDDNRAFGGDGRNLFLIGDTTARHYQSLGLPRLYHKWAYFGGFLYLSSGKYLYLYKYTSGRFERAGTKSFHHDINNIHVNKYGLWLAFSNKQGVYLVRDFSSEDIAEVSLPGIVNTVFTDNENGVWISTTDNGIFFLPYPDVINYSVKDGLASSVVYALDPISPSVFWAGYNTGDAELLELQCKKIKVKRHVGPGGSGEGDNHIVDIAHRDSETFILSNSGFLLLHSNEFIGSIKVNKSLLVINDSLLGIGGWDYMLYHTGTGHQKKYSIRRIYAQVVDENAGLWLGGISGLYHLSAPYTMDASPVNSLANIKVNTLCYHNGYLWAGTQNNGIYLLRNGVVKAHFTKDNFKMLPSNNVKTLASRGNELWIGTNRGLTHGTFDYEKSRFVNGILLDHNDGLLSPEINEIKITDDAVLVATYGGITVLRELQTQTFSYTVSDICIHVPGEKNLHFGDSVCLPYSTKGLEISIQAAALKYGDDITYQYRMQPFDAGWKTTRNNFVQYTNLPPGDYTFLVSAYDNRGHSGKHISRRFVRISPLCWQTMWFKGLVITLVAGITVLSVYYYLKISQRRIHHDLIQSRLIARAKLEALRAQLKPHFIFNSLNAIKDYIYNNKNERAADLLQHFALFVRKGLHLTSKDFTTIEEEIQFLEQYLELEQMKCDGCFNYFLDADTALLNKNIPSLITQPFVENAVIHGLRNIKGRTGMLHIRYTRDGQDITCTIEDNGIGIEASLLRKKDHISRGTDISRERINYFRDGLGIDIDLDIKDLSSIHTGRQGTTVVIRIKNAQKNCK